MKTLPGISCGRWLQAGLDVNRPRDEERHRWSVSRHAGPRDRKDPHRQQRLGNLPFFAPIRPQGWPQLRCGHERVESVERYSLRRNRLSAPIAGYAVIEQSVEILQHRRSIDPGRPQQAIGVAGVKLHPHCEIVPVNPAVIQYPALCVPIKLETTADEGKRKKASDAYNAARER